MVFQQENGAVAHINIAWWYQGNLNAQAFREDVDSLAAAGLQVVATSIRAWEITGFEIQDGHIVRNAQGQPVLHKWNKELDAYRNAFSYAKSKGLKVHAHVSPNWHPELTEEDYLFASRETFSFVAEALAEEVDVWQFWNEAESHDYRTYQPLSGLDEGYLEGFRDVLLAAAQEIRKEDPNARIAVNAGGFYGGSARSATHSRWLAFFDSLQPLISQGIVTDLKLNIYTEGDNAGLSASIEKFKKYGTGLWVGEFGVCTENRPFTQEDRRRILLETAGVLRQLNSIQGVNLYRMRDGAEPGCEGSFGIQEQTWAREVLQAMR